MRFWLVGICAIFLLATVSAEYLDMNIGNVRSGALNDANYVIGPNSGVTPNFSYARDVNIIIDFNIVAATADGNNIHIDINYGKWQATNTATDIDTNNAHILTNDLNLSATGGLTATTMNDQNVWCSTLAWANVVPNTVQCHYYWNIAGVADGNYFIKILVDNNAFGPDGNLSDYIASAIAVRIDTSTPVTG